MNSPIRYFGGKGTMFNQILKYYPQHNRYNTYIEPFGGSYSMGLKCEPTSIEIYNDINKNVYSLYKVLSDKTMFNDLKFKCDLTIYSEDLRKEFKEKLKDQTLSIEDRAFYFFYVNRTSHNGIGGFSVNTVIRRKMSKSVSDYLSAIDRLPELHDRISSLIVLNTDGINLIEKYNAPNVFIYADPPYVQSTRGNTRYDNDMDNDEQIRFINAIKRSDSLILVSGYDNELYDELLSYGFFKHNFNVNSGGGIGQPKTRVETVWINYKV